MIRVRGLGPLYWGVEWDSTSPDERFFTYAFLQETNPPWRKGDGHRIRLGRKELHFGTCKKGEDPEKVLPTQHSDPEVALEMARVKQAQDWSEFVDVGEVDLAESFARARQGYANVDD